MSFRSELDAGFRLTLARIEVLCLYDAFKSRKKTAGSVGRGANPRPPPLSWGAYGFVQGLGL